MDPNDDVTARVDDQVEKLPGQANYQSEQIVESGGAEEVGGSEQELETDDNALDAAHAGGLYQDSGESAQPPVNIADQVAKAEEAHRHNDD